MKIQKNACMHACMQALSLLKEKEWDHFGLTRELELDSVSEREREREGKGDQKPFNDFVMDCIMIDPSLT